MDIRLKHVRSAFLPGSDSDVWGCDIEWPGQTYVNVAAPSGTGKTTFMSILYGLLTDYSGQVLWGDQVVSQLSRQSWSWLRQFHLSIVFQDLRLFDQLSCLDNVLLKAGQTGNPDCHVIEQAFDRLGMASLMRARAGQCSQGEKQRVAFIRALMQPFDWIFLDEPFSHVDEACIRAMCDLLIETCEHNRAGMIVTSLCPDTRLPYHRQVTL